MTTGSRGTVLVTGGAGFLGSYVVRGLADRGYSCVSLDVTDPTAEARYVADDADVVYHSGDVRDAELLGEMFARYQPSAVMHVASIVNPVALAQDPRRAFDVNIGGTVNVLEQSHRYGVTKLVYFSSVSVLPRIVEEPIPVGHPVLLASEGPAGGFYGASKVAGEAFCMAANAGMGMDCAIVRPSAVYGLGMQWPMSIKPLVEGAVRGHDVHLDHGSHVPRDYTHAEDVASLAVAVLDAPAHGDRIFYGATGGPLTTPLTLADLVRELVPESRSTLSDEATDDDQREASYRGRLSIDNAASQLGWRPRWADIRSGLQHYVQQVRDFDSQVRPTVPDQNG